MSGRRGALPLVVSGLACVALFGVAEVVVRLSGIEPREWPAIDGTPDFEGIRIDPLLGALPRPGWRGEWLDLFATEIDDRGFRATGYPPPATPHGVVAFLGDSSTFGWGVDTGETFVARLDARQRSDGTTPAVDFVNAAYPGESAVIGEAVLEKRVIGLTPDLVVLGFSANNAFRFTLTPDIDRLRFFSVRDLVLRSRLLHVLAAALANRDRPVRDPKERQTLLDVVPHELTRVASPAEFATSLRRMIADARRAGADVLVLLMPRASLLSHPSPLEDASPSTPLGPHRPGGITRRELGLLELSCIEPRDSVEPVETLRERLPKSQPVYPEDPVLRTMLRDSATAFVRGDYAAARRGFESAVAYAPTSPLARYELGVTRLMGGDANAGLRDLAAADEMACNAFLHYQVVAWQVAVELGAPVLDVTMYFQAHDGEELYLDPAHPNSEGHQIIADALAPVVDRLISDRGR